MFSGPSEVSKAGGAFGPWHVWNTTPTGCEARRGGRCFCPAPWRPTVPSCPPSTCSWPAQGVAVVMPPQRLFHRPRHRSRCRSHGGLVGAWGTPVRHEGRSVVDDASVNKDNVGGGFLLPQKHRGAIPRGFRTSEVGLPHRWDVSAPAMPMSDRGAATPFSPPGPRTNNRQQN